MFENRLPSLFKLPRNRHFYLIPRYHNPEQEVADARKQNIKTRSEGEKNALNLNHRTLRMREAFAERIGNKRRKASNMSGLRFIFILGILLLFAYFILLR
jgi:hypothetical protein